MPQEQTPKGAWCSGTLGFRTESGKPGSAATVTETALGTTGSLGDRAVRHVDRGVESTCLEFLGGGPSVWPALGGDLTDI